MSKNGEDSLIIRTLTALQIFNFSFVSFNRITPGHPPLVVIGICAFVSIASSFIHTCAILSNVFSLIICGCSVSSANVSVFIGGTSSSSSFPIFFIASSLPFLVYFLLSPSPWLFES